MKNWTSILTLKFFLVGVAALLLAGCGKPPPPQQGPGGAFSVRAVVAEAKAESVQDRVTLVGSLQARESVDIASETDGRVLDILFVEGAPVTNGQVLVRLASDKPRSRLTQAQARFQLAKTDYERGKELLASETISQQEFDRLNATYLESEASLAVAQEDLDDAVILAPFDGVTGERLISPGQYVTPGMALTSLVMLDPLDAAFHVPERYLAELQPDQRVEITTAAYPSRPFAGTVTFVGPMVDPATRTVPVKAEVKNDEGLLRPGMYGQLHLVLREFESAVVIPEASIQYQVNQAMVVVMNDDGVAEFRPVEVGVRLKGRTSIVSGLQAGEHVVVEGHQKLGPGVPIEVGPGSEKYGVTPSAPPGSTADGEVAESVAVTEE